MPRDPFACPDPIADRRFAYGQAAAKDGDWTAAADLFEQTAERVPTWAPAHFALGAAREQLGDALGAAAAFRAALASDSVDAQGAAVRLALIEGADPDSLPAAYVARLFDEYAPRFEAHLTGGLAYRGPALLLAALDEVAPGRHFARALDLGCGTGLMGDAIRARVDSLSGVDLSPAMIAGAQARGLYDALAVADARAWLEAAPRTGFNLIIAADTLCYFGDLSPILNAASQALAASGLLTLSVETSEGDGFRLQQTLRFAHAPTYLEATARAVGLRTRLTRAASARREAGADVPGLIAVFEAPG
jgi:predicted TPR repeat methyltransferase